MTIMEIHEEIDYFRKKKDINSLIRLKDRLGAEITALKKEMNVIEDLNNSCTGTENKLKLRESYRKLAEEEESKGNLFVQILVNVLPSIDPLWYELEKYYPKIEYKVDTLPAIESSPGADNNDVPKFENGKVYLPKDTLKIFVYSYIEIHNEYNGNHKNLTEKLQNLIFNVNYKTINRYSKSYSGEIDKYSSKEKLVFKELIQKHNI